MITLKDFDESKIDEYSTENLMALVNEVDMKKSVIREKLASEMAEILKDERFDAYSFFGRRKLKKIAKKYDGALRGADVYMAILKKELKRREFFEEESKYSGKRIKRGLYLTKNNMKVNADVNAALNILRKSKPNDDVINHLRDSGLTIPKRLQVSL